MISNKEPLQTKFGSARFYNKGYMITSRKEGNCGKKLHRLIYEDYHKVTLLPTTDIHHIDGNPCNNNISNLVAMTHGDHTKLHCTGKFVSEETRKKLRDINKGNVISKQNKEALRQANLGNKYAFKGHPTIHKAGFINGKQLYSLNYDGKRIMRSIDKKKLERKLIELFGKNFEKEE